MKRILFVLGLMVAALSLSAQLALHGVFRNDMIITDQMLAGAQFSDILESRLILSKRSDTWRYYQDLRTYVYSGAIAEAIAEETIESINETLGLVLPVEPEEYLMLFGSDGALLQVRLMRAFVRYFSPIGDVTIGKTYVNFGIPGVFNPFELAKTLNFSDLAYDREGLLAVEYELPLGDLSGMRTFISPQTELSNAAAGMGLYANIGGFDAGVVWLHRGADQNQAGLYIQGDIEIGINASWAYHFEDAFNEISLGIDYSFFNQRLITAVSWYYADAGAATVLDYDYETVQHRYLVASSYVYGNIRWVHDEFFSAGFECFVNLVDASAMLLPSITYLLADGLTITLRTAFLTGSGQDEFSRDTRGTFTTILRCEARL